MAMLFSVMSFAAESLLVTLDFSENTWGLPVASANKTTATVSYTNGDYAITLAGGGSGNGHYYNNDGYLIFGKSGATLTLPAFDFKTTKIVVTGRNGASTSVLQNIYVGATAVSTQTKGAGVTNTYAIAEDYQAAGNVYVLKVTSSHNTQIVKMEIYGEEGGEQGEKIDAPTFSVTETNFNKAFDLTISSAEGTTLKYTTDSTDPKTSATAVSVETNTANVSIPAKSTVVKAVAVKGDLVSVTSSIVYAYVNSAETAYTVAEAMEVIDAGLGLDNELYIKGIISKIESFNSQYGSITYWIEDEEGNEFECYSGLGLNKAKFTSVEDIEVGAYVVACGIMKKYNTTYEFNYNNYLVEYVAPVEEPEYDMEIVCSNLKTMSEGNMTYFMGSSEGMSIDLTVFGFNGKGTYEVEGSIDAGGTYFTLAGEAEYLYSEELGADALVAVVTANGEMSLKITMYKKTLVPTETIVVENMTKTIQSMGMWKQLRLDGTHETYGEVTLMASGCDGTYGDYAVIAWLGEDIELEGEGEWKNEGELDVLEVIAETADGKVLKIVGQTEYVAPVEPVSMYADVEFTVDEEGILRVTGTTNDEVAVQLFVSGWNEVGYGTYGEGEVWGFIGDTEVANQQYTATIEQEGYVAYLYVILNDGEGNLYDLTAGGMALENPAAGAGSRTTVIVEEAEITTSAMFPTDLEIYGWSNDDRKVVIALWDGTTKQYGEYTTDFVVEVDDEQYDLLENTVATYSLEDGLAVLRAAVAAGKDTLDLIVSGAPWVDPATAEPTDTVTLAFTKGTINVSFDGTATIKAGNQDLGVQIFTMGGDIYEGITSEQFNSNASYLMIDWMQVKIYRGELKVVDLTNDVKVAYIGVLGTDYKWYNITLTTADEIPTTLDNINATVAPAKRINNGQLIIINNGVEYNAQGAIVK